LLQFVDIVIGVQIILIRIARFCVVGMLFQYCQIVLATDSMIASLKLYHDQSQTWIDDWIPEQGYINGQGYRVVENMLARLVREYDKDQLLIKTTVEQQEAQAQAFTQLQQAFSLIFLEPEKVATQLSIFHPLALKLLQASPAWSKKPVVFGFMPLKSTTGDISLKIYTANMAGREITVHVFGREFKLEDVTDLISVSLPTIIKSKMTWLDNLCQPAKSLDFQLSTRYVSGSTKFFNKEQDTFQYNDDIIGLETSFEMWLSYSGKAGSNAQKVQPFSYHIKPVTVACDATKDANFRYVFQHKNISGLKYQTEWVDLENVAVHSSAENELKHGVDVTGSITGLPVDSAGHCPAKGKGKLSIKGEYLFQVKAGSAVKRKMGSVTMQPSSGVSVDIKDETDHLQATVETVKIIMRPQGCGKSIDFIVMKNKPGVQGSKYGRFSAEIIEDKLQILAK
jgi:hypothetical protein